MRTWYGLGSTGVSDRDELLEEHVVLVVVPVTQDNGELFIVGMHFLRGVDDYRCTKSVDVLALTSSEQRSASEGDQYAKR